MDIPPESYLRKEKLLGDSLCGAQTPQRVNGSVQLCFMFVVIYIYYKVFMYYNNYNYGCITKYNFNIIICL